MICKQISSLLSLVLPLASSFRNNVLRCEEALQKTKKPKVRKLKGLRVTFEDQMAERDQPSNEDKLLEQERRRIEQNPDDAVSGTCEEEDRSCPDDSELDSSHAASSAPCEPPVEKRALLSVEEAEELIAYVDLLNIRMVHSECASACLLRKNIADARERLREAKRLLDAIPDTLSPADRKTHMLGICGYVEGVFASLNRLTLKMVDCHSEAMCDALREFVENLRVLGKGDRKRPSQQSGRKLVDVLGVYFLFAFFCIAAVAVFLIWQPQIGLAIWDFLNWCSEAPVLILNGLCVFATLFITVTTVRIKF